MGFSSYDDLISELTAGKRIKKPWQNTSPGTAGIAGRWYSTWAWTGSGSAGSYAVNASLTSAQYYGTTTGAIFIGNAVSPDTKHLLSISAMSPAATAVPGIAVLVDRLLTYPGIVATTSATQTLTTTATLPRYTDGAGVVAWLEVSTALGNAGAKGVGRIIWSYTNSDGVAGRVNTNPSTVSAIYSGSQFTSIANTATSSQYFCNPFISYFASDSGIRSVEQISFNSGTMTAGFLNLILGKVLATVPIPAINVLSERDLVFQMANMERVYDGACLSWLIYYPGAVAANTNYIGEIDVGWG